MVPSFQLSVPADARYRRLASEVAAKYAALAGCPEEDVRAVLADVDRAATDLAGGGSDIALDFAIDARELHVRLTAGERSTTVRRALAAVT
jgi:hypothetical protein